MGFHNIWKQTYTFRKEVILETSLSNHFDYTQQALANPAP